MYVPVWQMPHHIVLLAMLSMLVARAIYVPSSARRTLMLTGACGVPVLVSTYLMFHNIDSAAWNQVDPELRHDTVWLGAAFVTAFAGAWWGVAVALSTAASMVIYGLRRSVRNARKLGQYELVEKLGEGGMGVVFRAEHAMLRRPTAVKLLPPDKVGSVSIARFEKEVQQTARLTHPNTVTVFDYGRTPEGVFYYAMELLDGSTLQQIVEVGGPLAAGRVSRIIEQVARALAEAHNIGLIHRDIKPAHIMLVRQGDELDVAKVLDFGLVKEVHRDASNSLTQGDSITGTPQFLSPEGITAPSTVDARSDIYALGALAYYLLCGEHVFGGSGVVEICSKHLYEEPSPLTDQGTDVPPALAAIVMRCLAKEPSERPQSARELAAEIRACAGDAPAWTEDDAVSWWAQFGPALAGSGGSSSVDSAGRHTIDDDVARRTTL
jgi:serine/threonine protein kinase